MPRNRDPASTPFLAPRVCTHTFLLLSISLSCNHTPSAYRGSFPYPDPHFPVLSLDSSSHSHFRVCLPYQSFHATFTLLPLPYLTISYFDCSACVAGKKTALGRYLSPLVSRLRDQLESGLIEGTRSSSHRLVFLSRSRSRSCDHLAISSSPFLCGIRSACDLKSVHCLVMADTSCAITLSKLDLAGIGVCPAAL